MNDMEENQQKNDTEITEYRSITCWAKGKDDREFIDVVAQEVAIALVYNGISHAVMMASPKDLEDFALGFSLSEGIIEAPQDILGIDIATHPNGIEINVELSSRRFMGLKERRRTLAGRTGCGLCGIEQLNEVSRAFSPLSFTQTFPLSAIESALSRMRDYQPIGSLTGCTHAALWLAADGEILGGCEDIGRHVALDKVLGVRSRQQWQQGAVLVSSRASYEMVQKAAICGVEILFAISAPTAMAIDIAKQSNLTLVGFTRPGRATIYTYPQRII